MIPSTAWSRGASAKTMFAALPPSSSVRRLPGPGGRLLDPLADLRRARERDLPHLRVRHERGARRARARDHVDDAGREVGLLEEAREVERGERRRLGRLQDRHVPARERRRELPRGHEEREIPRDDLPADADRARLAARERVVQLVGPARVIEKVRRRERHVDVARLLDRLAAVHRLEDGELARLLLQHARDPVEVLAAFLSRHAAPVLLVRAVGRAHRGVDVGRTGLRDGGERLFGGRVDRGKAIAATRAGDPLSADEEIVRRTNRRDGKSTRARARTPTCRESRVRERERAWAPHAERRRSLFPF